MLGQLYAAYHREIECRFADASARGVRVGCVTGRICFLSYVSMHPGINLRRVGLNSMGLYYYFREREENLPYGEARFIEYGGGLSDLCRAIIRLLLSALSA